MAGRTIATDGPIVIPASMAVMDIITHTTLLGILALAFTLSRHSATAEVFIPSVADISPPAAVFIRAEAFIPAAGSTRAAAEDSTQVVVADSTGVATQAIAD